MLNFTTDPDRVVQLRHRNFCGAEVPVRMDKVAGNQQVRLLLVVMELFREILETVGNSPVVEERLNNLIAKDFPRDLVLLPGLSCKLYPIRCNMEGMWRTLAPLHRIPTFHTESRNWWMHSCVYVAFLFWRA